jgi:hypothetical protein
MRLDAHNQQREHRQGPGFVLLHTSRRGRAGIQAGRSRVRRTAHERNTGRMARRWTAAAILAARSSLHRGAGHGTVMRAALRRRVAKDVADPNNTRGRAWSDRAAFSLPQQGKSREIESRGRGRVKYVSSRLSLAAAPAPPASQLEPTCSRAPGTPWNITGMVTCIAAYERHRAREGRERWTGDQKRLISGLIVAKKREPHAHLSHALDQGRERGNAGTGEAWRGDGDRDVDKDVDEPLEVRRST